jgi:hypothetical protein
VHISRVALAALFGVALVRLGRQAPEHVLSDAPQGITTAVATETESGSHVFAGWWGSWLEYADPSALQFVDARAELFPTGVWDEYFEVSTAGPKWPDVLDRYGVDIVVASRDHQGPLIAAMTAAPAWREVYADGEGAVFVRRTVGR